MKNPFKIACVLALMAAILPSAGAAEDTREKVNFPEMMKQHQLSNMRDHLAAQEGDLSRALDSLSKVTQQCVACHSTYRVQ